jgi:hypothetical protein
VPLPELSLLAQAHDYALILPFLITVAVIESALRPCA